MHSIAIKARLAVQVGHLYKSRNAERNAVHVTRRARQRRALALLRALRRVPPCAAAHVAPKPFPDALSPQILFQQAARLAGERE